MAASSKLLAVVAALAACCAWTADSADDGYAEPGACATCHRQIAESYARTGMGRSFFRPASGNTLEAYASDGAAQDIYHAASDTHYAMIRRGDEYYQRRWQLGFAGQPDHVEELRIDYVMGSGNHARSYLHRTARGTLIELPLGWYPEPRSPGLGASGSGHWGMSPGFDSDRPRTRRFVSYKCMFCHNGIPQIPAGNAAPGSDPIFTGNLPEGIDCQRCHGPGGRHLRVVRTRGSTAADVRASIVNPARLTPRLRMEICMQCHLETSSGRIPATLVRFDRAPFSYRPGEPLDAFMLTFDHAPGAGHDEKFEAVSSVYRLRQSRCFRQAEDRLTCDTCHNPHRVPRGSEAVTHYAQACRQCHAERQGSIPAIDSLIASGSHTAAPDCAGCHMPKRRAEDTPGMVMTDHLIQRRPPPGDLLAPFAERPPEAYHGEVVPYYPAPLPQTATNRLYLAVAQVGLENNVEAGLPVLEREIATQQPREAEFYRVLGDGRRSAGRKDEAVAAYERAMQLRPQSLSALRSLADGLSAAGQLARAEEILKRALPIAPNDPLTWYRYGMLDFSAGRLSEAAEKVRKAIALDPSLPDQSRSLSEILMQAGQPEQAEAALHEALRTDPYDAAAWDLAGRLSAGRGNMPEAFYDFEKALRLRPGHATYHYDFALALVRADRFEDAQTHAEAALRADPTQPDAHELLGGLYTQKRQYAEAAREYRRTLELRPASARTHLRLANVLSALGDAPGAAEHWREAARTGDPAIAQEASRALRQAGGR